MILKFFRNMVMTCNDVFINDGYVVVSIISALFVIEAQSVKKLVLHSADVSTPSSNRELLPPTSLSNIGPTSVRSVKDCTIKKKLSAH